MLADHFAAACLLPEKLLKKMWPGIKDVNQMAAVFDVPRPVVWLALKFLGVT
jgi:Zn-dependent peptidase ImmA (M78 family)